MFDLISEILQTLRTNKLRTALTGFAVSWGIFLLIVLLSVAKGLTNKSADFWGKSDQNVLNVSGGWTTKPYKGYKEWRPITLDDRDLAAIESGNSATISDVHPVLSNHNAVVSTRRDYVSTGYEGVDPQAIDFSRIEMASGRFINPADMRDRRRVAVLSENTAADLFEPGTDPIGQTVTINELNFTVIGTYSHDWTRTVFIPFTVARGLAGGSQEVTTINARMRDITTSEESIEAENALRATLARQHDFDPTDNSAVWIWNRLDNYLRNQTASSGLNIAVWILGVLTLISGIVGVSNIMFVSVRERTHEIGIRRAIGARPASILRQVILESVAITTLFGYIGIVAGMGVAALLGMIFSGPDTVLKNPQIDFSIALQVTVVLIVAGALAGLFPALKSLKIKPVEALRDE